jgi:hypothetical protein
MSDDFEDHDIPDDLTDDIQDQIDEAVDERIGDLYEQNAPARSSGCLLIIALPALCLWFW